MKRKKTQGGGPRKKKQKRAPGITDIARVKTSIVQGISALPDRMFIKMKYAAFLTLTPVGSTDDYVFRGNSIFDPDLTGTGHQPLSHDQWQLFFLSYRVRASAIDIDYFNTGGPGAIATVIPSSDSSSFTSLQDMAEAPRAKISKWSATASRRGTRLHHYVSTAEVRGVDPARVEMDDLYSAAMSANPTSEWYWHVASAVSSGTFAYQMLVKITYYVELFGRVALSAS